MKAKVLNFVRGLRNGTPPRFQSYLKSLALLLTLLLSVNVWGAEYEELFTITSGGVVSNTSYTKYTKTVDDRGWIITFGGNNVSVGTNSSNRSKCNLSSYSKYAVSPVTISDVASAFVSTTSISNVSKISYTFNGGSNQTNTNVYLIYSSDGNTFSQVELTSGAQGAAISSGTAYEFAKCSGYFGLLFKATNSSGNWRIDNVSITFYKATAASDTYSLVGSFGTGHDWNLNDVMSGSGTVSKTMTLAANSAYEFKIAKDKAWTTTYGNGGAIVTPISGWVFNTSAGNCRLYTGPAGEYTFTFNPTNAQVSVTYPTNVSHPAAGYSYFEKYGSDTYIKPYIYTDNEHRVSDWDGCPYVGTTTTICGTTYFYFALQGCGYNNVIVRYNDANSQTASMSATSASQKWANKDASSFSAFSTYSITFNGNGASGSMAAINNLACGANQAIPACTFTTPTDKAFDGWKANVNVTINNATVTAGTKFAGGVTLQNITSDITLTAQWLDLPKYTVTLKDDNTELTQEHYQSSVDLPSRTTSCAGYTFEGWSTTHVEAETSTKPTIIAAGNYTPTANIELWPVFSKTTGGGTKTDVINASMTSGYLSNVGSTTWYNNSKDSYFTVTGSETGNEYIMNSMGLKDDTYGYALRWNDKGWLQCSNSANNDVLTSITITGANKTYWVYASVEGESFYPFVEDLVVTNGTGTFTLTGDTTRYLEINGTASSSFITSITLTYGSSSTTYIAEPECYETTITLAKGTDGKTDGTATAAKGSSTLSGYTAAVGPDHYHLLGYYDGDTKVIDASGHLVVNAGSYTDGSANWQKQDAAVTLTAKWEVNSHTLTWNLNGGTAGTGTITPAGQVAYGTVLQYTVEPTKAGKKFNGWSPEMISGTTTMPDNDQTYTAQWVDIVWTDYLTDCSAPYTWTIWYEDPSDSQWKDAAITEGQAQFTLAKESTFNFKLRKTNVDDPRDPEDYTYYGAQHADNSYTTSGTQWTLDYLNSAGYDVHVVTGAAGVYTINVTNMTGDAPQIVITYPTAYTITFAGNGADDGSMTNVTNIAAGEGVTLDANAYTKTGNHFKGWVADVDVKIGGATVTAGTLIADGATIQDINSNITLTAQWETKVTALTISQESGINEIVVGEDVQLTLTVTPNDAEYGTTYTWYSSNTSTMTVDYQTGLVTGVQANTGDYIYVRNNDGVESNHYVINVKSAACDTWGLHMWNTKEETYRDFCFTQVGSTTEWRTQQVTLPSNSDNEKLKVLYAGMDGDHSVQWITRMVPTVGYIQGGCWDASDGNRYAGQDAKGYFRIYDNSTDPNYYLAFQPVYAVIYGVEGQTWQQVEFTDTETANNFYTDIVTVPEGYDSNVKIYAGTSKASGVNFISGRSSTVNMNTITGLTGSGMAGKAGKFKINDNYCNESNFNLSFIRYYRLHYNLDGGAGTGDYTDKFALPSAGAEDRTFTLATAPTRDGYTFRGWSVSIGGGEATTKQPGADVVLTEDAVVTAIWAQNYTVTYDLDGYSTSCSSSTVHYCGEEVTVCDAPEDKTGYTFMGWNTDDLTGSPADFDPDYEFIMPCHDVVFTAHYEADEYDITYLDQNGGAFSGTHGANHPISHTYGTATTLVNPTKTGYTFGGWYLDEPCTGAQVTVLAADGYTANITLYAKWTIQTYTVTFDLNGGQGTAPTALTAVPYNSTISAPDAPADYEDGSGLHTFIGWYKENTCTNAWNFATDVMPDADLTLYAKWSGVTYEDYRTHCCTPLPAPTGGVANNITMITATLSWGAVSGNNGYQVSADQTSWVDVLSGESYDLTDLTAGTPYIYYVRAIGDNNEHCQYGTTAQIEFTTKAALHITYKANGGTGAEVVSEDIEEGTSATVAGNTFTAPTGMTFNGWNTQAEGTGTAYAVGATINPLNADLTLYAQWIGATFNVTYELDGGTGGCTSTTATYNSTFTICSAIPTNGTNAFTGWSSNVEIGGKSTFQPGETFTMPASDVTLTAQWAESYTVTYVINNVDVIGHNPAGDVYVARGQSTTLPDFVFSCGLYNQFIGWVDAEVAKSEEKIACPNLVGEPGDSFTPTGNITLYALFGHDAENLGWVKQTTISSGKYLMANENYVMTGFNTASNTSNTNYATVTSATNTGSFATKPDGAVELEVIAQGNGSFAMKYGTDYIAATSDNYLNYQAGVSSEWTLLDGNTKINDALGTPAAGAIYTSTYTRVIYYNSSRFAAYANASGKQTAYLYKLINEGYYTTSPTCEIPTSVTVTYNKNTEDEVTMCGNATLEFTTYPHLTEAYTLCAAANVVREGYVLRTWNTAANGTGKNYTPGTVFTELGNNLNLYAQWDRVYTVTFHDKYGSAEATTTDVTQASLGSSINVPSAELDDDCITFVGWTSESTVQSGNPVQPTIVIAAGTPTYTPTEDKHLYAIYSKEGSALDFAPATEGVRSFYLANTALTAYATGTISTSNTGSKFSSEATTANATPIFIDYQTSHVGNYKYTIRTANGYLAPASGSTKTNFMSQAEPYYWNILSGSDGGYNIKESTFLDRQISISDASFGFYQSATSVKLVPCAASTFWSNPTCAEFVTITFQTVGDITIDWTDSKGSAEDYKDLPINTSITQWPTAQYEGWTFAGWSKVDYSNSSKYAGSFAEDTKNGTIQPDQSDGLYANENATLELIANNNYNMYPIFTKVHESTEFDEALGGDYLIYFKGEGTRYKDDYTKFDDEYLRVYATNYSGSAYRSTSSCAEAYTFTFVKRADGNWDIKRGTNYLCNTSGNDISEQAGLPGYGWTMTKQSNGSYIIHYLGNADEKKYIRVFDDGLSAITQCTFKCYSEDQAESSMYKPVFIGSCVERQYSSEPSNKPTLEMAGAVYTTSTNGQNVRSATGYTIKGSFLKANTEISLTDALGNAIAGLSIVGSDGKVIKADTKGTLASTTAYVVYNPTETTDGITNMKVYISAVDRNEAAIRSAAPSINNIHLRHLPAKFLIAQKVGADWYALPNDMSASMSNPAAAKLLSVNEATGTATIYSDVENIYAYTLLAGKASTANMVFNSQATGRTGSALRSSDVTEGDNITKMGLYATGSWTKSTPAYEFAPATEDLKDYTLTNALQNADLGIADGNWVISGDQTVRFFAIDQQTPINLTLTGDVALTSATGIEVYGNQTSNLLTISADYTNVAKLRYTYNDGTSDVAVSNSVFRLNYYEFPGMTNYNYADATTANHRIDVSTLTGEVDQTFSVSLKPTAANTMYNYTLTIAALDASNNVMEEKQITLKGRSLPERFVIAMKSTNGDSWYALPNDLATSTSEGSSTKAPIMISVDNTTAPTKALMAPKNTLYKGDGRYQPNSHRNAIRFLRADATDNAWITTTSTSQLFMPNYGADKQQFNLLSSDLAKYTITQDEDTRTIAMYGGTIGWYDSGSKTVYLLPVDASAEPAVFDIVEWFPTKLLIESSQAITNTSVKVGTDEAVAGTAGTATYGTNLYEVQTGDLTAKAGQAMSVSYTIEATTYAKVVTVPIILSRGTYATSGSVFGGLDAPAKYQYNDLVVRDGATLTVDAATGTWNKFVNVTIYPTSKVVVPAQASDEKDVTMTTTTMTLFGGTDEIYNGSEYTLTKYGVPQLVLNGKLVHNATTSGLVYDVRLDATQYYNFALPYTSKYELVTDNKGGEDFTFWTKIYDGATRAAGNNGWVWYNWNADPWAINIGTGYMFAAQPYAGQNYIIIRHPMGYDATENADGHRTSTAEATKAAVDVYAYPSKYDNNAGWNYIANPFMANFTKDLGDGCTGTIQTGQLVEHKEGEKWDGHYKWEAESMTVRYVTLYDNGSDTYEQLPMSTAVLAPFTGFFVQMAETGQIVFDISGRTNEAPARMLSEDELPSEMEIFLHATCQGQKDDAVLFINDNLHRDNAKEFPNEMTKQENANTLNFYTFGGDDIKMYANGMSYEDAQGWSKAGVKVATAGEYTFSVASDQADYIQQVILRDMDSNTEYDLMSNDAKIYLDKGEMNDRFYVKIVFGKHNIGTGVTERYDTSGPEKFILNDHMYIRANGVLFDGVGKRVKY